MVKRNPNMAKLPGGYLFPEINRRKKEFLAKNPDAKIISLGIGNTTEPLLPYITKALENAAKGLGTKEGYSGYGDEQGMTALREKIAAAWYKGMVDADDVFISDGAKCDCGRLQIMFGEKATIAVQDPAYPVYVDGSVIAGETGAYDKGKGVYKNITYMACVPENNFFPDLKKLKRTDLIYFCSPNNPTGAVATQEQLAALVAFAKKNKSIIVYDAAYAAFIRDKNLPRTIFEIPGAKDVAIEVSSLSKPVGFTGVRLGWTVVPKELKYDDGSFVHADWNRIMTTIFNGASNIAQLGALAVFDDKGKKEMEKTVAHYMENARIIRDAVKKLGYDAYGGVDSPYVWVRFPEKTSWEVFNEILEKCHVVVTPGSGFGPAGEGFVRLSAFGHRKDVEEAVKRLEKLK